MALKWRFALVLSANTVLALALFGSVFYVAERRTIIRAQESEQARAADRLASVCRAIHMASSPLLALNYLEVMRRDPSVLSAECLDRSGAVLAGTDPQALGKPWPDLQSIADESSGRQPARRPAPAGLVRWTAPVTLRSGEAGLAVLTYDRSRLDGETRKRLSEDLRQPMLAASSTLLLSVILSLILAMTLSRPIGALEEGARSIAEGNLDFRSPLAERGDELGKLAREMNEMARKLKIVDEMKDDFISYVSHDLRNPMTAMAMQVDYILQDPDVKPKHRELLGMLKDHATRLNLFVANLLQAARLKTGRLECHPKTIELGSVLRSVESLFGILAAHEDIRFKAAVLPGAERVKADPEHLEHAVMNLASNAIKFTEPGGEVAVTASREGGKVLIRVKDSGPGIAPADLDKLFKRFSRVDEYGQKSRGVRGTGLGLYIVNEAVRAMGGQVAVRSKLGEGTEFAIELPAEG